MFAFFASLSLCLEGGDTGQKTCKLNIFAIAVSRSSESYVDLVETCGCVYGVGSRNKLAGERLSVIFKNEEVVVRGNGELIAIVIYTVFNEREGYAVALGSEQYAGKVVGGSVNRERQSNCAICVCNYIGSFDYCHVKLGDVG